MKRRLLNLLSILSLLLCVAVVALWVRSYWRSDEFLARHHYGTFIVDSELGTLMLDWDTHSKRFDTWWDWGSHEVEYDVVSNWSRLKWFRWEYFAVGHAAGGMQRVDRTLWLPHWSLLAGASLLPSARAALAVRRRRRQKRGRCPRCGYDLRATPGRCPECGYTPVGAEA